MYLKSVRLLGSLMLRFRNGSTLIRQMRAGQPCDELVLWDGTRIAHPARRHGLLEAVQEIWIEQTYTAGFYRPRDGDVIVDAGANIGLFAIYIARQNPKCTVHALKPFAENFNVLEANILAARASNITCHKAALGADFGRGEMKAVGARSLDHVLRGDARDRYKPDDKQRNDVGSKPTNAVPSPNSISIIPLSGVFDLTHTSDVDFLKVDIEGSEHDVFANAAPEILRRFKRIALEYHDQLVPGTLAILRRVLAPTHELIIYPSKLEGCGILRARLRDLRP